MSWLLLSPKRQALTHDRRRDGTGDRYQAIHADSFMTDLATEATVSSIRKTASGRQFALKTWHPDAGRVDPETFWLVWRDGVNWALTESAKMSTLFQEVAEHILL